jgi:hypothetical protein
MERRDFLKLVGGAAGGLFLPSFLSCSNNNKDKYTGAVMPNGYQYSRLFTTGDPLPDAGEALFLPGSVFINDLHQVFFHAGDRLGRTTAGLNMGIYQLDLNFAESMPVPAGLRKRIRSGETHGGKTIETVGLGDSNSQGYLACKLFLKEDQTESIHLDRGQGLEPLVAYLAKIPGYNGTYAASLGNFDLYDENILITTHYMHNAEKVSYEGLFNLPLSPGNGQTSLLAKTGDLLPGTFTSIDRFGLFQGGGSNGAYVFQAHTTAASNQPGNGGSNLQRGTAVLTGRIREPGVETLKVVATNRSGDLNAANQVVGQPALGETSYGSRIGANGKIAGVTHVTDTDMVLSYNGAVLLSTGARTPQDRVIYSFGPPVVGPDGLVYFVAYTDENVNGNVIEELIVSNGRDMATYLTTGVKLGGVGSPTLLTIAFGLVKDQVDSEGRLVFVGEFDNETLSVIMGIPV